MKQVINLTQTNFEQTLSEHDTVLVDFWAPWCAPCKFFAPIYEAAAERHPDVVFAKVNVDEEPELLTKHQIRAIPTLKVFRDGEEVERKTGAIPATQLDEVIAKAANG
ncbi:MAG: thioredoxin [Chromatiales bacterium]|nr:thioredoxin [Chromatiales bacterium]